MKTYQEAFDEMSELESKRNRIKGMTILPRMKNEKQYRENAGNE